MGGRCPILLAAGGNDHALEVDQQLKSLACANFQSTFGLAVWRFEKFRNLSLQWGEGIM